MSDGRTEARGQLSDPAELELINGARAIDGDCDFIPLHLSKRLLFWEEVLALVLIGYSGLAFLKVFKVLEHSHISMAVGPAIFGCTGLLGTFVLFKMSRRKRALRSTHRQGRYRLGIFLLEDRLIINLPRLLRSIPYSWITRTGLETTFEGQGTDAISLEYEQCAEPHKIRIREPFGCSHPELAARINQRLTDQNPQV